MNNMKASNAGTPDAPGVPNLTFHEVFPYPHVIDEHTMSIIFEEMGERY